VSVMDEMRNREDYIHIQSGPEGCDSSFLHRKLSQDF
jgi:hypothetical protein